MKSRKRITVKESGIHQKGVFALETIPRGEKIVRYTGRRLTKAQSARSRSLYLFELNKNCDIDGRNIARYINHSCEPNCQAEITQGQIWIHALKDIPKGRELTYSYRYSAEEALDYPCLCGSGRCKGYILAEEEWPKLKRALKRKPS